MAESERERRLLEVQLTGEQVRLRLTDCIDARVSLVKALAGQQWIDEADVRDNWAARAAGLASLYPGVQALNYIDRDWRIRVVVPLPSNVEALGQSLRTNSNSSVITALAKAETTGQLSRTGIISLLQGGKGFALYRPIASIDGESLGYVNGVFRIRDLMNTCLSDTNLVERFRYAVSDYNMDRFFVQPEQDSGAPWPGAFNFTVDVASLPWQMVFAPSERYLRTTARGSADAIVLIGLLLTGLLTYLVRMLMLNQRSLKDSEEKYRVLIENQSDMVAQLDKNLCWVYASPSFCRTFDRDPQFLIGDSVLAIVHEDDEDRVRVALARVFEPPFKSYYEARSLTRAGYRWMAWSNTAVFDDNGKIEGVTCFGRDVSEIKALEAQVSRSQKMQAMGEMAGGITHDFNNLLHVMLGNVEFLILDARDEDKQQLEQIRRAIDRAMHLTGQLATLSRQQLTEREVLDLRILMPELHSMLERTIPQRIVFSVDDVSGKALNIYADPTQIEQVILNLCFNARDAMDLDGCIRLVLGVEMLDDTFCRLHPDVVRGEYATISVIDNGIGIPPESLARVFDPFFSTKGVGGGTGLGLSNCYSIVRQHEGLILAESEEGVGTTFIVYLPLTQQSQTPFELEAAAGKVGIKPERKLVLVVDDDPEILDLTAKILAQGGYDTVTAVNGHDAFVTFSEHKKEIAIVVMDLVMPVMDGKSAAGKIREIAPGMPIVFASGYSPDGVDASELGGPLLGKPFRSAELLDLVAAEIGD